MNHTVSDLVIRIKNACMAKRKEVEAPYSGISKAIAEALVRQKYIEEVRIEENEGKKMLVMTIRYERRIPVLTDVKIISKPSLRKYAKATDMAKIAIGQGVTFLSTSKGVFSDREARKQGLGGELLFKIW